MPRRDHVGVGSQRDERHDRRDGERLNDGRDEHGPEHGKKLPPVGFGEEVEQFFGNGQHVRETTGMAL